ncbi:MAG: hypothetical protein ACPIOQ_76265, partial [Promethearchaeia archaeon]
NEPALFSGMLAYGCWRASRIAWSGQPHTSLSYVMPRPTQYFFFSIGLAGLKGLTGADCGFFGGGGDGS